MEDSQLKATAFALLGFVPEWTPSTCAALCSRIEELGTIPAVYLQAVAEHIKVPCCKVRYASVILAPKWEQFIDPQLQLMQEQAKVRLDSDMLEFRSAMMICAGDYREVLEDTHIDISSLGRYRISKMYGFLDTAEKFAHDAMCDALANPFLKKLYDKIQEDD